MEVIQNARHDSFSNFIRHATVEVQYRMVNPSELQSVEDPEDTIGFSFQSELLQSTQKHAGFGATFAVFLDLRQHQHQGPEIRIRGEE